MVFFVDLPQPRERLDIFQIHLRKVRRDPAKFDLNELVGMTDGYSGAEIEQAIIAGLHDSFFERRDLETGDIRHWLRFGGVVTEIHDVAVLQGARRPMLVGFQTGEIRRVISMANSLQEP